MGESNPLPPGYKREEPVPQEQRIIKGPDQFQDSIPKPFCLNCDRPADQYVLEIPKDPQKLDITVRCHGAEERHCFILEEALKMDWFRCFRKKAFNAGGTGLLGGNIG